MSDNKNSVSLFVGIVRKKKPPPFSLTSLIFQTLQKEIIRGTVEFLIFF